MLSYVLKFGHINDNEKFDIIVYPAVEDLTQV